MSEENELRLRQNRDARLNVINSLVSEITAIIDGRRDDKLADYFASPPTPPADVAGPLECARILAALEDEHGGRTFPTKADCAFARSVLADALEGKSGEEDRDS